IAATSAAAGARLVLSAVGVQNLIRAVAPGAPGSRAAMFAVFAAEGRACRFVSVLSPEAAQITLEGEAIAVTLAGSTDRHRALLDGWDITPAGAATIRLGGRRPEPRIFEPLVTREQPLKQTGLAVALRQPPALDGTLEGFDLSEPLALDHED